MVNSSIIYHHELIHVIVNNGLGSKVLHSAKNCGITGGTVLLGRGTVNNKKLDFLGISDVRKEIVLMVADGVKAEGVMDRLDKEFKFDKPNHGIAYTMQVTRVVGTRGCKPDYNIEERGVEGNMYQAITVIVERGKAEDVIDAATKAGSKGGTIINGRGSGIHETSKLFFMDIEPEKEIIIILSKVDKTNEIVASISKEMKIEEPGNGIIFVQEVNRAYGLYE